MFSPLTLSNRECFWNFLRTSLLHETKFTRWLHEHRVPLHIIPQFRWITNHCYVHLRQPRGPILLNNFNQINKLWDRMCNNTTKNAFVVGRRLRVLGVKHIVSLRILFWIVCHLSYGHSYLFICLLQTQFDV